MSQYANMLMNQYVNVQLHIQIWQRNQLAHWHIDQLTNY